MYDNYNYPLGADTPDAPWNEPDIPEKGFDVCISQTLSKSTKVITDDYYLEEGCDEDGPYRTANTSNTDWRQAYDNDHYTPLQLIGLFKEFLEKHLPDPTIDIKGYEKAKSLIAECENWTEDETEVVED